MTECLLASPYVKRLDNMELEFHEGLLSIRFDLISIYGMVQMEVTNLV